MFFQTRPQAKKLTASSPSVTHSRAECGFCISAKATGRGRVARGGRRPFPSEDAQPCSLCPGTSKSVCPQGQLGGEWLPRHRGGGRGWHRYISTAVTLDSSSVFSQVAEMPLSRLRKPFQSLHPLHTQDMTDVAGGETKGTSSEKQGPQTETRGQLREEAKSTVMPHRT